MNGQVSLFEEQFEEINKSKGELDFPNWLLVDGNNLMNRCYYATAKSVDEDTVQPTNAVSGFIKSCLAYQRKYEATVVVFFDKGKGFRKNVFPEYKDGRNETPKQLETQFPLMHHFLDSAGIPYYWSHQVEADDLISSATNSLIGHKYIVSNDKDLLQTLREDVTVIVRRGKEDVLMTPTLFRQEWGGLEPCQIVDLKALAGDNSDNIPGVIGIGDKGAMSLIQHFKKVENIQAPFPKELKRYESKFEGDGMEKALFFKKLTTLVSNTPIILNRYEVNYTNLKSRCVTYEMKSVVKLLNKR